MTKITKDQKRTWSGWNGAVNAASVRLHDPFLTESQWREAQTAYEQACRFGMEPGTAARAFLGAAKLRLKQS